MAKNKESKDDSKNRSFADGYKKELDDLNCAHDALMWKLMRDLSPLDAIAALHGIHAAMMKSEMESARQLLSMMDVIKSNREAPKKKANGKAEKNA
jgi:hypothetical protein